MQFPNLMPIAATDAAVRWNSLYNFLLGISVFFFVLVIGAMILFIIKYRAREGAKTFYFRDHHFLEACFIAIPTILLLGIFGWGYSVYNSMMRPPADALEIHVIGKQWLWQFQYDNGRTTIGNLYVPLNKPVKLIMTSQDVIHDFFIPNFRVKSDVVPGMYTSVWFEARVPGEHQVFCGMYCGTSHSQMLAKLVVLNDQQWAEFQRGKKIGPQPDARLNLAAEDTTADPSEAQAATIEPVSLATQGRAVFETKGCVSCHSAGDPTHGGANIGPSLAGIFGKNAALQDGQTIRRDESYLRQVIEQPQSHLLKGYQQSVMPTFKGLISETEMNSLIAYIKSLK
ncbi:MAG: cytochrome c oxidase subunit II [Oligoflexia bacterium]|nr:cytochrome c oxidase subunit II [Oligoflexia bacterium]